MEALCVAQRIKYPVSYILFLKSQDIIYEKQEQYDTFEQSFPASAARPGIGEEMQRGKKIMKKKNRTAVNFGVVQERSFFPFTLISGLHGWHMERVLGTPWPGAPVLQVGL